MSRVCASEYVRDVSLLPSILERYPSGLVVAVTQVAKLRTSIQLRARSSGFLRLRRLGAGSIVFSRHIHAGVPALAERS